MGLNYSQIPEDETLQIFTLSFTSPDLISLINAPETIRDRTYVTINSNWSAQVQSREKIGAEEIFQLAGWPLVKGCSYQSQMEMKNVLVELVKCYFGQGWKLLLSCDLSRFSPLSTCFFVYTGR